MDVAKRKFSFIKLVTSMFLVSLVAGIANCMYVMINISECESRVPCGGGINIVGIFLLGFVAGVIGSLIGYVFMRNRKGILVGGMLGGFILILYQIIALL